MAEGISLNREYEYLAFISYSHHDITLAQWLQESLEFYQLPTYLFDKHPNIPHHLRPIFRDETDLELGILNERIQKALSSSKYLIVICSPHSTKSKYVSDEIDFFLKEHDSRSLIPFIINGIPYSKEAKKECLPLPIRSLSEKPLAANINEYSKEYALVKVVSYLLGGIAVRRLWDRYRIAQEKEAKRKEEERMHLLRIQSLFVSGIVESLVSEGNSSLAQRLAVAILPSDLQKPDRPYVSEAEKALRDAYEGKSKVISAGNPEVLDATLGKGETLIAATMLDGQIKVWDSFTGQQLSALKVGTTPSSFSSTLAFSPDGDFLFFCDNENLYICNLASKQTRVVTTASPLISAIIPLKNTKQVMTVGPAVEIWDTFSGQLVKRITGEDVSHGCRDVAICEDKQIIVAITLNDNYIVAYSLDESGNELWKNKMRAWGEAAAYAEGKDFVVLKDSSELVILDINSGKERLRWKTGILHYKSEALAISHDGCKVAVSVNYDICVFDLRKALTSNDPNDLTSITFTGHFGEISSLEFSQNDDYIISSSRDGSVRQYCLHGEQEKILLRDGGAETVSFRHPVLTESSSKMILRAEDGSIGYYDYKSRTYEHLLSEKSFAKSGVFSHDDSLYYFVDNESVIHIYGLMAKKEVKSLIVYDNKPRSIRFDPFNECSDEDKSPQVRKLNPKSLVVSPDNRYLLVVTSASPFQSPQLPQQCIVFRIKDWKELFRVACDWNLFVPAFSSDSTRLFFTHKNKLNSISINDGAISEICDFNEKVTHILCPQNKPLIICASGQSITAFDIETRAVLYRTEPLGERLLSFVSISDEYFMYTLSTGIRILRAETGNVICDIPMNEGESLWDAAFDSARECIIGAYHDLSDLAGISHINNLKSYIKEWDFPSLQKLINTIKRTYAEMPLSEEEKKRYYLA